jgi:hypothetical protein
VEPNPNCTWFGYFILLFIYLFLFFILFLKIKKNSWNWEFGTKPLGFPRTRAQISPNGPPLPLFDMLLVI